MPLLCTRVSVWGGPSAGSLSGGLCPGMGGLSRGVSVQGSGSLSRGSLSGGNVCPGGSLSGGGLCPGEGGVSVAEPPPRILLECILVLCVNAP